MIVQLAEKVIEDVSITRMDLMAVKRKKLLAEKGYKLLTEKRDTLVMKFFEMIDRQRKLRTELYTLMKKSFGFLIETEMIMGENKVEDISSGIPPCYEIKTETQNVMGVKIPKIVLEKKYKKGYYSYMDTCARFDDTLNAFQNVFEHIIELCEVEGTIETLAAEIEKTKRKVNALDHIIIPRLNATIKHIEMHLEEREREDFFRRKKIKAGMQK